MHFGGGGDMDEMMRMMMGGGMGGMGGPPRRRRGKDVGHALPVSLEDLYMGKVATVEREKTILCPQCKGSGSNKPGMSAVCRGCQGQGARMVVRQVGPGMMQQAQVRCEECGGRGSNITDKDKCKGCSGERTKTKQSPLKVNIERGMEHNDQIPFMGEGDQHPDIAEPGAVVMVLQQLKHDRFERMDNDLKIKKSITLAEAVCGTTFIIRHLDDAELQVTVTPEDRITPGEVKCVKGKGMPVHKQPGKFGDLVIEFNVTFPESLTEEQIAKLKACLPPPAATAAKPSDDDTEECYLSRTPLDEMRKQMEKEAEEDDDDEGGPGGVRCASQ